MLSLNHFHIVSYFTNEKGHEFGRFVKKFNGSQSIDFSPPHPLNYQSRVLIVSLGKTGVFHFALLWWM